MSRTELDRKRFEFLRGMLEQRRREIMEKLRTIREAMPVTIGDVTDPAEHSVNDFVLDMDFALVQMKAESLQQIDGALQQLEQGRYGTCGECGREIPQARLQALPFATLCIGCQEEAEERHQAETRPAWTGLDDRGVGPSGADRDEDRIRSI